MLNTQNIQSQESRIDLSLWVSSINKYILKKEVPMVLTFRWFKNFDIHKQHHWKLTAELTLNFETVLFIYQKK